MSKKSRKPKEDAGAPDPGVPAPTRIRAREPSTFDRDPTKSIPEQIAGNNVATLNWMWPGAHKDFPGDPRLQTVDECYPFAKDGPLLVDFIADSAHETELTRLEQKAKLLKKRGYRYLRLTKTMGLFDAMIALGEANIDPKLLKGGPGHGVDNVYNGSTAPALG